MRKTFLVCYDICHPYRLAKVHKTMRGFGDHLQYSIFECQLTPTDLARCRHRLSEIINHRDDQVLFVDLGPAEGRGDRVITAIGKAYAPIEAPCLVVDGDEN
jgi:CRISPR-associated protein Cas2